jgi:hypothetical protein
MLSPSVTPHSHSIVNETAKHLILFGCSWRRKLHTVTFTVAKELKAEHARRYDTALGSLGTPNSRATTEIANSGVPVKIGMQLTAHRTITQFTRYVHTEDEAIRLLPLDARIIGAESKPTTVADIGA